MSTWLIQQLALKYPLIQAPMAGVQNEQLTIAACKAGALGSLPCAMLSVEQVVQAIENIQSKTEQPYNLNFFCHTPPAPNEAAQARWLACLKPYYEEFGLSAEPPQGGGRTPFSNTMADAIEPYRPPVLSFHFGLPDQALVKRIKSWGSMILSSATTVAEATWLAANGADVIIAQGLEAGGHRGHFLNDSLDDQMGLFALLPQIVDAVDIPVIAAGGIADKRGVQAALQLGASGVQIGTRFLTSHEATTSAIHRRTLMSKQAQHTQLTNLFSGRPARGIVNRIIKELGPFNENAPAFPSATPALAPLRTAAEKQDSGDFSPLWSGENAQHCKEESTRSVIESLFK